MDLSQIERRLESLSEENGFSFSLGRGASEIQIHDTELRLTIRLPEQVKLFYSHYNGLRVSNPKLNVLALERLSFHSINRLHFAVLDDRHNVYFDVSGTNAANQWNISSEDGYLITLTMASFWSNKIWAWIKHRKAIWKDEDESV